MLQVLDLPSWVWIPPSESPSLSQSQCSLSWISERIYGLKTCGDRLVKLTWVGAGDVQSGSAAAAAAVLSADVRGGVGLDIHHGRCLPVLLRLFAADRAGGLLCGPPGAPHPRTLLRLLSCTGGGPPLPLPPSSPSHSPTPRASLHFSRSSRWSSRSPSSCLWVIIFFSVFIFVNCLEHGSSFSFFLFSWVAKIRWER